MENREVSGLMAGIASSGIGGMATAVTRYAVAGMDPVQVTFFRFGIAFTLLCPLALVLRKAWPCRSDWAAAACLGIMFYGGFFVVFAYALTLTTAARGALGIATLPVVTMLIAAAMRREPMTLRKSTGVLIASGGVAFALASGLEVAPEGAWRGDLTMIVAIGSMALYTILSRPFIERSSALGYACFGMGAGAAFMGIIIAGAQGLDLVRGLSTEQWASMLFLGIFPGAIGFFLWVFAAERTTPTRLASTITINPITAGALAAVLVHEPFTASLLVGVCAVAAGIWVASTESTRSSRESGHAS